MTRENIATFNLLLTLIIAKLYETHPATITLDGGELWVPPLRASDPDFEKKKKATSGTLLWLYQNGFVAGMLQESNGEVFGISGAQLTAQGYRLANHADVNAGGLTLGQVAFDAASNPESSDGRTGIDLVARRFTNGT
jgi:hypothetical protein